MSFSGRMLAQHEVLSLIPCCKVKKDNFPLFVSCADMCVWYALVCTHTFPCVLAHIRVSTYRGLKLTVGALLGGSPLYFLRQDLLLTPEFKF